jgi:hypothetical protein
MTAIPAIDERPSLPALFCARVAHGDIVPLHAWPGLRRLALAAVSACASCIAAGSEPLHTFDGRHDISIIDVTSVYFVTSDRRPLPDWRERAEYYLRRVEAFHCRELDGQSALRIALRPQPLVVEATAESFRQGDGDFTFFRTMDAVRAALAWPPAERQGYPILLVLSDINWRELDDFRRERLVDGVPRHEGAVAADGRHFPGAESGGARATYHAEEGFGMGLVSGDGWRVPYSGSDCVVYHEGLGHTIGLPHPEPNDDSVMGTAQYRYWIHETWLNREQKLALGWQPPAAGSPRDDLFSRFTALQDPPAPAVGESVFLRIDWPPDADPVAFRVRVQTDLWGPWHEMPVQLADAKAGRAALGSFDRPTPVSYRVDATLRDGQTAELWGYFQVRPSPQ